MAGRAGPTEGGGRKVAGRPGVPLHQALGALGDLLALHMALGPLSTQVSLGPRALQGIIQLLQGQEPRAARARTAGVMGNPAKCSALSAGPQLWEELI